MVTGVSSGYTTYLELNGIGYKASYDSSLHQLTFNLGFSHPIVRSLPSSILVKKISSQNNIIELFSVSLVELNNFASSILKIRPSDKSFKGTGIKISRL